MCVNVKEHTSTNLISFSTFSNMASELPNAKKEPPWLPLLPPMPRISVPSKARARLSHRRPIVLSPGCPLLPVLPSPLTSSPLSETLPPLPSASPSSPAQEHGAESHSCPASSACQDVVGIVPVASSDVSDVVPRPADDVLLSDDNSYRNRSLSYAAPASQSVLSNSDEWVAAHGRHSSALSPILHEISSSPAMHRISDNGVGSKVPLVESEDEAKGPNSGISSNDSSASRDLGFPVAGTASSPYQLDESKEVDTHRGADIFANQDSSAVVSCEAEVSDLHTNGELAVDECELEEGQLPGEWSGAEESHDESEPDQICKYSGDPSPVFGGAPMVPDTLGVGGQVYYPSQIEESFPEQKSRGKGNSKAKCKKNRKHRKGEGSKKRARDKSKDKYSGVKKKKTEGKGVDDASNVRAVRQGKGTVDSGGQTRNSTKFKNVPDNVSQTHMNKPAVDEGPEDGEIFLEPKSTNNGILSSLVEAEVGLWTTDDVDDQFVSQMEEDGAMKKKRGPETAERKLKRKIAKRKKRAQKERELGIRRPPRTVQSKPVKVLCTHYMKGRCAKGDQCTFSHDAVPLTKQEARHGQWQAGHPVTFYPILLHLVQYNQPCKFLMSNSCLKGDDCPYSHDLGAFPCKFFHTRGLCYDGANCQFSHGAISEEAREKLHKRVEKEKKDRISSATGFDIPTPAFSTPLPPELDPDPLGWGTPSSYPTHEGLDYPNPRMLDMSTCTVGDFDLENHPGVSPSVGLSCGLSTVILSSAIVKKGTQVDAFMSPRTEEEGRKCEYLFPGNVAPALGSESGNDLFKREAESPVPCYSALTEDPYTSLRNTILNVPVCQPPNERSNVRKVLEVSMMEERMDAEQTVQEESWTKEPSYDLKLQGPPPLAPCSLVSPAPPRTFAGSMVPVLRGRQLGSRVLEHKKTVQCPVQSVSKRQHTVESLLDEALRH